VGEPNPAARKKANDYDMRGGKILGCAPGKDGPEACTEAKEGHRPSPKLMEGEKKPNLEKEKRRRSFKSTGRKEKPKSRELLFHAFGRR